MLNFTLATTTVHYENAVHHFSSKNTSNVFEIRKTWKNVSMLYNIHNTIELMENRCKRSRLACQIILKSGFLRNDRLWCKV